MRSRRWVIPLNRTVWSSYESKNYILVIGLDTRLEGLRDDRGEYQTHTSHLVSSMGPIVSVLTSHGQQNPL